MDENVKEGIMVNQPKTMEERMAIANTCYKKLGITFTAIVDEIDDMAEKAYAAWPDRLYIVDKKGIIVYKGERGPEGFKPLEMAQSLAKICST